MTRETLAVRLSASVRQAWWFLALSVKGLQSYPQDFVIGAVGILFFHLSNLAAVYLVFNISGNIGGWTARQAVFLAALSNLRFAVGGIFFAGLHALPKYIRTGKLDQVLTRPVSPLFTLLCVDKDPADLANVAVLAAALVWSAQSFSGVGLVTIVWFIVLMALGLVATFGFTLLVVSPSFWATAGNAFPLVFRLFWEFEAYPTRLFPSAVRFLLTWIFPVAVAVFIPSEVLLHGLPWTTALATVGAVAAVDALLGLALFRLGLKRYHGGGH